MTEMQKMKFLYLLGDFHKKYSSLLNNFGCDNSSVKLFKGMLEVMCKAKAVDDQLKSIDSNASGNDSTLIRDVMNVADEVSACLETHNVFKRLKAEKMIHKTDTMINDLILDKIRPSKLDMPIKLQFTSPKCLRVLENPELLSDMAIDVLLWAGIVKLGQ